MNDKVLLEAVLRAFIVDHAKGMTQDEIHRELIEDSPGVVHIFPYLRGDEVFHLALDVVQSIKSSHYIVSI